VLQPLPTFLSEGSNADRGLICGYQLSADFGAREVAPEKIVESLAREEVTTWLHFNLADARARRWLLESTFLPEALREVLQDHSDSRRIEKVDGDGLLLVAGDFTYEEDSDPSEVAAIWCFSSAKLLITARVHPLKSSDDLRQRMRTGLRATSGIELLALLLDLRTARIKTLAAEMVDQLDDIEDQILAGNIELQREQLGRARRLCARLRRHFAPERSDMSRFMHRHGESFAEGDRDALQSSIDSLGLAIEEIAELYERAKLLQEELASRLAENTNRNLYALSILTAVLLPMTLVTGIFGMNVAGLPGMTGPGSFWWVMVVIFVSGAVTLALLFWRRLL
jgi:zinc transporter